MRRLFLSLLLILLCTTVGVGSEIREFDIPTLEKLGKELWHQEKIAAVASDIVSAQHPEFSQVSRLGWIIDLLKGGDIVYLIDETREGLAPAYKMTFLAESGPIEDIHNTKLPAKIALRYKAKETALEALGDKLNAAYNPHYNIEVLDDPNGKGFLVYALATFAKRYPVYVGGHVRVTVSADGTKAQRIDQLSHSIIELKANEGATLEAISTAQAVKTPYPVETWIYSSEFYRLPMYVATTDGAIWGIVNGRIVRADAKGPKNHLDILNGKAPEVPQK